MIDKNEQFLLTAELLRVAIELLKVAIGLLRVAIESLRLVREVLSVGNESLRVIVESLSVVNEVLRLVREVLSVGNEPLRVAHEVLGVAVESLRLVREVLSVGNESLRLVNESLRFRIEYFDLSHPVAMITVEHTSMSRSSRVLKAGYCYHITVRCNNREFRLTRLECREVLLYALKRCQEKYAFKVYALCIMSNHVHYLLEPAESEDLPKIMHWLNWYAAMCFNRMMNRTGHFWEKRYHSTGFPIRDQRRALNTLRYIHANSKAANIQQGFFYDFSNYGTYDRLTEDGITQWHPAFLALGTTLDICAAAYRKFCQKYQPKPKPEKRNQWGSKLLAKIRVKGKAGKISPGQKSLWEDWDTPLEEIRKGQNSLF